MADAAAQPGTTLHGPGGLLGTPGLGARRTNRKWGMRTKAKQIVGNLYRGDNGKFQAGGASTPAGAKPARGRQLSKQPKPAARTPIKTAAPKKGGGGGKGKAPKGKDPAVVARQQQRDQEHAADRAQRQADRQARLARQAQRDQEHAQDRADRQKRQQDAAAKRATAQIDRALAKKPEKPAKPAGGGGSKKPSAREDKRREQSQRALDTAGSVGISPDDLGALRDSAEGLGGHDNATLTKLGLIGADGMATDQGRRALSALERGDVRQYQAALQDAKARMGREQAARDRKQQAEGRRTQAQNERQARQQRQLDRIKQRAQAGDRLSRAEVARAIDGGILSPDGRWKSFAVFKDHAGQHRWIARTTTAYRDRDNEIIASDALDQDSQRMMATKQFGPLRYWHVGQPDPLSDDAPWGPGLDIGDCDFSMLIGPVRIESGTFRDPRIGATIASQADRYELSPGFFHPIDQPAPDNVFHAIRTFERSLVPTRYGRASNLFTGLAVKEHRMDITEMERRFKAAIVDLGLDKDQALALGQQIVATQKAAAEQGIAFKSADTQPVYTAPDGTPGLIVDGQFIALKAAAAPPVDEAMPAVETQAAGDMPMMEPDGDETPMDEPAGDYIGDMTWDAFAAKLAELLAPVLKIQDMVKSMGDMHGELKSMYGGATTKDDARAQEIASLKAQQSELARKLAEIEGTQPSVVLPNDVAEALKSTGPAAPPAPDAPDVPNDPSRPFAAIAARTMPQLYSTAADGGFAGWVPPAPA